MNEAQPLSITATFAALDATTGARTLPVTPTFWPALEAGTLGDVTRLVSGYAFDAAWPTWERHPAGEEVVLLLTGQATLQLQDGDGPVNSVVLTQPGDYVLVPTGVWHTASTEVPTTMLFITPGDSTEHRPVTPRPHSDVS